MISQLEWTLSEALKKDSLTLACMIAEAGGDIRTFYESFKEAGWKNYWRDKQNMKTELSIRTCANGYMVRFLPTNDDPLGQRPEIENGPYVFETFGALTKFLDRQLNPENSQIPVTATELMERLGGC